MKKARSLHNVRRGKEESDSDEEEEEDEEYHRRRFGGDNQQSKERLLFGASENDEDMYVFASPQQPDQGQGRRQSLRGRKLSPRSNDMQQTYMNHTDAEHLQDSSNGRRPLDVVVGARSDDEHLFQAMHSPIKHHRRGEDESEPEEMAYEQRRQPINVDRESSTSVIDRANDAARKSQDRYGKQSQLEQQCARILADATKSLEGHLSCNPDNATDNEEEAHTEFLMDDCDGSLTLTQGLVGRLIIRPRLTEELLERPPFRFIHDIITEITKATGLAEGMFDFDTEMVPRSMGKAPRLRYLEKVIVLVDAQLQLGGLLVSHVKASKIVAGLEPNKTNKLLQLFAVAAHVNPHSSDAVVSILGFVPDSLKVTLLRDHSLEDGKRRAQEAKASAIRAQEEAEAKKKHREELVRKQAQNKARKEFQDKELAEALEMQRLERVAAEAAQNEVNRLKSLTEDAKNEKSRLRASIDEAVFTDGQLSARRLEEEAEELAIEHRHKEAVQAAVEEERRRHAELKQMEKKAMEQFKLAEKEKEEAAEKARERKRQLETEKAEKELLRKKELEEREMKNKEALAAAVAEERARIEYEELSRKEAELKERELIALRLEEEKARKLEIELRNKEHKEAIERAVLEERARIAAEFEKARKEAEEKIKLELLEANRIENEKKYGEEEMKRKIEEEEREKLTQEKHSKELAMAVEEAREKAKEEIWEQAKREAEKAVIEEYEAKQQIEIAKNNAKKNENDLILKEKIELEQARANEAMESASLARQTAEENALKAKAELEEMKLKFKAEKEREEAERVASESAESDAIREELKKADSDKLAEAEAKELALKTAADAHQAREIAEAKAEAALKELEDMRAALNSALVVSPVKESNEDQGIDQGDDEEMLNNSALTLSSLEEISKERKALAEERRQLEEKRKEDSLKLEEEMKKLEVSYAYTPPLSLLILNIQPTHKL